MIDLLRASEKIPFAVKGLADREYLAGTAYSIADILAYAWARSHLFELNLGEFPHVERWLEVIASRPATERACALQRR